MSVKLLLGEGAHLSIHLFQWEDREAETVELHRRAVELLVEHGLGSSRTAPTAEEVNAEITVDLGEGGRAMWVGGGRDLSVTEVCWALAAGLEGTDPLLWNSIKEAIDEEEMRSAMRTISVVSGKSVDDVKIWLQKPRKKLGGRSPWDILLEGNEEECLKLIDKLFKS